jgi:hypothetical protein
MKHDKSLSPGGRVHLTVLVKNGRAYVKLTAGTA